MSRSKKDYEETVASVESYFRKILDKDLSVETLEDFFVELSFINPKCSNELKNEFTMFPENFFRNKEIYNLLLGHFTNVIETSDRFISQKRFRSFLALLYLKDFESERTIKMFCAKKTFKSIEANIDPLKIAGDVYLSGNFKESFSLADVTFFDYDNLPSDVQDLSKMI